MDNHSEWTYWVGAIIWRMHEGVLQFLVQDVRSTKAQYSRYGVQIKFPGGNALVAYDEKNFRPELQLARELHEETYLTLLSMGPEIHREFKPPEHWQFFFLVEWAALTG